MFELVPSDTARDTGWTDWKWQQRNAVRSVEQLRSVFPGLAEAVGEAIKRNQATRRLQITPYALSLIRRTEDQSLPLPDDPLWRQWIPYWESEGDSAYAYDGATENWELADEMVTPITQRKYDNRIIVRLSNACLAYCQFCYEALRTLETNSSKQAFQQRYWEATLDYLRSHRDVEEVILSGGEPLLLGDEQLERLLADLRNLGRPIMIRIHTRALTFNPFRISEQLEDILSRHRLSAVGLHVSHPHEITPHFVDAVERLRKATPILFANIPLLRGVNDTSATIHELGMRLYSIGVVPQTLFHFLPHSPGATEFRTSVRAGIDIVRTLKRRVTNLAVPEFVVSHRSGKHTMPLLAENEQPPEWDIDANGRPVVRYTNWRGELVEYPDVAKETVAKTSS